MELICMICTPLLAALIIGAMVFMNYKKIPLKLLRRILAVLIVPICFYRYMIEREAVFGVRGLNMYSPFGGNIPQTVFSILLIWFTFSALFSTLLDAFFEYKTLRNLSRFFGTPILILDLIFFKTYAIAVIGKDAFEVFDVRMVLMCIEIALALAVIAAPIIEEGFTLPKRAEVGRLLYSLPFALLVIMPTYVPQALIGFQDPSLKIEGLTPEHRLVLYFSIIIPFCIYHVFKNKSYELKRFVLIYLSLALMWTYISYWTLPDWASPINWPLHLCNTAMFLIPLCLCFKWEKLFYFCLFINVMGAVFAMILPNTSSSANIIENNIVNFWVNHYPAFFMPILIIALKIFKRPKFREWVYSLIVFTVYFIAVLFLNAWLSNYGDVDFFFLNSDFIVDKLGKWAEDTRDIVWSFKVNGLTLTFYPLYQALFYLVYVVITVGIWFLYALLFSTWDAAEDRRLREKDYKRMKKELNEFLQGRSIHEPATGDSSPRLILRHFSKRYGNNKHYSVDDVSFEVKGGEIFGFLGPNGAGKSTIIKSVVGIQTITSGSIEICGYDCEKQSVQAKQNLGFVPDHYALYENLTGREYINYIADLYQINKEYRDMTIDKYVNLFQLTGSFDNQMKTYSHGMKQKITIMAALVHDPKLWILDEPLTGLDPTSIFEVKEAMKEHAAKGNIVFFSSHIIDVVEKICDRIAIIKKGKLRACIKVSELEEKGIDLEQFYLSVINEEDAPEIGETESCPIEAAAQV